MIKAFLFDYDGVITAGVEDNIPAKRLAHNLSISFEKASEMIIGIWDGFSIGKLTESEVWQKFEQQYGRPIGQSQRDIWYTWKELTPLPEMIKLVQKLKANGYIVGLISNALPQTATIIRKHGGYDTFDF